MYKKIVRYNTSHFLDMVKTAVRLKNERKRLAKAVESANFAVSHAMSIYSSEDLENIFLELANRHKTLDSKTFQPGSVLHVMTEAYVNGGHSRCVERWLGFANKDETHSCVLLRQTDKYPARLKEATERTGGTFFVWDPGLDTVERALALRRLASNFEYIVLHIHPGDPSALIAFGTESFQRPVIFFNHADHIFWLGVSIADCVADLSGPGLQTSLNYRKAARCILLGIPPELEEYKRPQKEAARQELGLAAEARILCSFGSESKYLPVYSDTFLETLNFILEAEAQALIAIIGPSQKNKYFAKLCDKYPGRLLLPNKVDYESGYQLWMAASDLVLDSYPVSGGTTAIDAVSSYKPVLTLNRELSGFLGKTRGLCNSPEEFKRKSLLILRSPTLARKIAQQQQNYLKLFNSRERWLFRLKALLTELPERHQVYRFDTSSVPREPQTRHISVCRWIEPNIEKNYKHGSCWVRKFLKFLCVVTWNKRKKKIYICGVKIIDR